MNIKFIYGLFLIFILSGCSEDADGLNSIGRMRQLESTTLDLNRNINRWTSKRVLADERQELMLLSLDHKNDSSAKWALALRSQGKPAGSVNAEDIEVKLLRNYTHSNDYLGSTVAFKEYDVADTSYLGVTGYVHFDSNYSGYFEVGFQQETDIGSGITFGPVMYVEGCWRNDSEGGFFACSL